MRKILRRNLKLVIIICTVFLIGGATFIHNVVMADSNDFYLYYINTADNNSVKISEYTIDRSSMVVHLGNDVTGIKASDIITWYSEDESILTVEPYSGTNTSATITCIKPGKSKVWADIKRPLADGDYEIFSIACNFTVRLAINDYVNTPSNNGHVFHLFEEDAEDCGSLVMDVDESFDFKLKIGSAMAEDLSWTSLNNNIATIDEKGTVTGIQPGIAKILVQTYDLDNQDNILQSDYIYVVVKPKFKNDSGTPSSTINVSNPTILETNISDYISTNEDIEVRTASEFAYIVKNADTNEVLVDTYKGITTPKVVTLTPSTVDGDVRIDCVAGKYTVEVYPIYTKDTNINVMEAENYSPSKAKIVEYVEVDALTDLDYVQVNDVWDLYLATNIYNIANDFDINTINCEYSKEKGTITFTSQGLAMVQFKKKNSSNLPLDSTFTSNVFSIYINVKPYTAQNMSVTIMKGKTETLSVSDYGYDASQYGVIYDYEFKSNDERIASVFCNEPKKAVVTGVKEGTTTVDCIIKYNNGISRKMTWNIKVWKTISAKLDITEKEIMIDQQISINAQYPVDVNPESDINVKWVIVSSDLAHAPIEIVNNDDRNYKSVSILGKSEGQAIVTLRDMNTGEDLDSCTITVVKSTTIRFKETDYDVVLDRTDASKNVMSLDLIYEPKTPERPKVEWKSSEPTIATVENGVVTYKKAGYTYITATYYLTDNLSVSASCRLNVYQKLTKITLNKTTTTVNAGDEIAIIADYSPEDYVLREDKVLTWSSDNEAVVKVSGEGPIPTVKAIGPGSAKITVRTTSGLSATCVVTVTQLPTGVTVNGGKPLTMSVGSKVTLVTALAPLNVTERELTFTSSNDDYLTIDEKGVATAVSAGTNGKVTLTVDVKTKNNIHATLAVTIIQHVTDMKLNYSEKNIAKGTTFSLKPTITPSNAYNKGVTYVSSKPKVASVSSSGVVTGLTGGYALISCISKDTGLTRYCVVVVKEKVTTISLNKKSYVLGVGKTYTLKATVKSNFATNTKVKWTSSNKKIATVTSSGIIKGIKPGYATIRVTAQDGSGKYASCVVRIVRNVTKIKLNKASAQIVEGNSLKLKATVSPSNATVKSVSWKSDNESVAYVDTTGKVIAVEAGRCKITATAKDGSKKSASCIIQVIEEKPISGLTIVNKNITMVVGESETLKSFVSPKKNTDSIRWYTDDSRIVSINAKTGKIKARRTGQATITLASASGKSTTTTVTVVGLNRTSLTMEQYDTYQLRVINGRSVQWDSSKHNIVKVTTNGKLSARKVGTSYITAIVNGRKIRCKVKVKKIK